MLRVFNDLFTRSEVDLNLIIQPCVSSINCTVLLLSGVFFFFSPDSWPGLTGSHSVHTQLSTQPKTPQIPLQRILELSLNKAALFQAPYSANSE